MEEGFSGSSPSLKDFTADGRGFHGFRAKK